MGQTTHTGGPAAVADIPTKGHTFSIESKASNDSDTGPLIHLGRAPLRSLDAVSSHPSQTRGRRKRPAIQASLAKVEPG